MTRDYRKLAVFVEADALVPLVYRVTVALPASERYGLQVQIRKAAVSAPTNLVEGSSRRSTTEYCRFVEVAYGSAREVSYLLLLATRLGFLTEVVVQPLVKRYDALQAGLYCLLESLCPESCR
ncbi:MAG TPA: four helix bundle protein [Vicinamibacterales bacterium]|nr:four helix bundle protein [Vicinamibacterales bacterium]